jgi:hypothetical protein
MSCNKDWARLSVVVSMMPISASVWCSLASMASIYPFGGPRFRDGPRKVHSRSYIKTSEEWIEENQRPTGSKKYTVLAWFTGTSTFAFTL